MYAHYDLGQTEDSANRPRVVGSIAFRTTGRDPTIKFRRQPDRQLASFREKRRRAATASGVGVGEAVPDQYRANSLNTGWVKVPVKFPALAVVGSERGLGENPCEAN